MLYSNRKFRVVFIDKADIEVIDIEINDLTKHTRNEDFKDTELQYALQEQTDKILDLKVHEQMMVCTHRDNPIENNRGLIVRIN